MGAHKWWESNRYSVSYEIELGDNEEILWRIVKNKKTGEIIAKRKALHSITLSNGREMQFDFDEGGARVL